MWVKSIISSSFSLLVYNRAQILDRENKRIMILKDGWKKSIGEKYDDVVLKLDTTQNFILECKLWKLVNFSF